MKVSQEATARALYALIDDMVDTHASLERLRIQIAALAARHGIPVPLIAA